MKQLLVFLLVIAAALGGWYGRDLLHHETAEHAEEEHKAEPGFEIEDGVLKLEDETAERLGLETSELKAVKHQPAVPAVGRVLDPAALIALHHDLIAALAALEISRAEAGRAEALFQQGESVPKKNVLAAQAQQRTDQIKLDTLRSRLPVEWGSGIAKLDDAAREKLTTRLAAHEIAIVRLEAAGELTDTPQTATLTPLAANKDYQATSLAPAPSVNERTQAPAFFATVEASLAPGMAVTARLEVPGEATESLLIPASALVRHGPQTWLYCRDEKEEHHFTRLPVNALAREGDDWLIAATEHLKPGTHVLTTGAAALLSAELTAAGAGGGEEP